MSFTIHVKLYNIQSFRQITKQVKKKPHRKLNEQNPKIVHVQIVD